MINNMETIMIKELPIVEHPIVEAFQRRAFELSAFQANGQDIIEWLYGKYLNCMYTPILREKFNYTRYDNWFVGENATLVSKIKFNVSTFKKLKIDLIQFVCEMLDNDNYIFGYYDEFYIPNKIAYESHHFRHDFMIYGYDNYKRKFLSIGYTINRNYEKFEFTFEQFVESIYEMQDNSLTLHFCKINKKIKFETNIKELYGELDDFLHSRNRRPLSDIGRVYGLDAEREYINYIKSFIETKEQIDVRFSRLFMELKNLMLVRLQYINANVCKLRDDIFVEYQEIVDSARVIHCLFMKYNILRNTDDLVKTITYQNNIINKEQEVLYDVYKRLKKYLEDGENEGSN